MPASILIVDDDPAERQRLAGIATREGHAVETCEDGAAALVRLAAADGDHFKLILLDLVMPELDGIGVLRRLAEKGSRIKAIIQTTVAGAERVPEAIRAGALDYLVKPAPPERLVVSIRNALRLAALEDELARSQRAAEGSTGFDDIIATDPGMKRALMLARRAAASDLPILIEGEAGTGKALLARAIHDAGDRRTRPFVLASAASLDSTIRQARSGTLLIEEIGRLPSDAQAKLMALLSTGDGGKRPASADIRILATASDDLQARVRAGLFREDLYYRLGVLPIRLPPLRSRREAIPELVDRLVTRLAAEHGRPVHGIAPDALAWLAAQDWPGNVRQLEKVIARAVALSEGPRLTSADFPGPANESSVARPPTHVVEASAGALVPKATANIAGGLPAFGPGGDVRTLAEIEAAMIELALERYRGRMATVARKLGIGRSTLYRKLKELGISESAEKIAAE